MIRRTLAVAQIALVLAASASGPPTFAEIEGEQFANVRELGDRLDCGPIVSTLGYPPDVDSEDEAIERGDMVIGLEAGAPRVAEAFEAGGVWLLIDPSGHAFGGIDKSSGEVFHCHKD